MQCPNCGHQNSADAKFCSQCGTGLSITCPVCSTVSETGAKFCSNCGTGLQPGAYSAGPGDDLTRYLPKELLSKLRSARAGHAMKGERRTVTMLFADIIGSTSSAEQLDPEDWAVIVNGAFEHLISPVYRFEGTLAHLQGDSVLAFFGAPIAHEDDPVRALRAGLEIIDAIDRYSYDVIRDWGIPVEVRIGVNTGLVVVGEVGSDLRVEYTALGDAINVAARMEQTADPGTVRVTGETLSLTGGMFEVEDLGPIDVKGKTHPVDAFRVVRFVGGDDLDLERPILGRDEELAVLDDLRSRLVSGTGWIASIIGEAGVGKSRLVSEFRRRSADDLSVAARFDDPGDLFWIYGLSRSYDSTIPYAMIREVLRRWWSPDGSTPSYERVAESVSAAGIGDPDAAAFLSFIGGLPLPDAAASYVKALETPVLHSRASETLTSYLAALAAVRPGLIVLEDLHWADDLSLALIEQIMELTERSPIGLVFAMRPYREDPTWRIHEVAGRDHHHRYHHLDLVPLAKEEGSRLIETLLGDTTLTEEAKHRILERSDGNPLFIEQMVSSLKEAAPDRVGELAVPTSLSGILTARLDRLDDDSKFVVQMASVLGSEFERDTLAALLGNASSERYVIDLLRRGILVEKGESDSLGFRHALIQEAAYSTILIRTRRDLHQRVADFLIDNHPAAVQDIARHLIESDAEAAFPYLIEAGLQATRSMALADAIRQLTKALANRPAKADPDLVERAHAGLGEAYSLVPDLSQAAAAYQQLYEYGEQLERPSARVAALNNLGYATASLGMDLEGASAYLEDARRLAEETGDELGLAQYHMNACFVASMAGQLGKAVAHDEATVELGEKNGADSIRLAGLTRRAINYMALLDFERGVPAFESALQAAEEANMEEAVAILRMAATTHHLARGDFRAAVDEAEGQQATLVRYSSFYSGINQRNIGAWKCALGQLEDALSHMVETRRLADRLGQPFVAGAASAGMALAYATLGLSDPIDDLREDALTNLDHPAGEFLASSAWADLGFCNLLLGSSEQAESDFTKGLTSSSTSKYMEQIRLLCGRSMSLALRGDLDNADMDIVEAREFTSSKSFHAYDALIDYTDAEILLRRGHFEPAEQILSIADQTASERGLVLLQAQIQTARARAAHGAGDLETEETHAQTATGTLQRIAASITEEGLRTSFASRWLGTTALESDGRVTAP